MNDTQLIDALLQEIQARLVPGAPPVTRETLLPVLRDVLHQTRTNAEKAAELQERVRKASAALVG
jgi:hypothetical protein